MLEVEYILLLLRVVLGLLFVGHGLQKLFGWFGGGGLEGTAGFFENLNVHPPYAWAVIAALGETLGGVGLVFGFLTPLAAAAIIGVMLMAIVKVHWQNGLWNTDGGFEYNLVNLTVAAAVGLAGPGAFALDTALNLDYPMPLTFVVALIAAILGVIGAWVSGEIIGRPETETPS